MNKSPVSFSIQLNANLHEKLEKYLKDSGKDRDRFLAEIIEDFLENQGAQSAHQKIQEQLKRIHNISEEEYLRILASFGDPDIIKESCCHIETKEALVHWLEEVFNHWMADSRVNQIEDLINIEYSGPGIYGVYRSFDLHSDKLANATTVGSIVETLILGKFASLEEIIAIVT